MIVQKYIFLKKKSKNLSLKMYIKEKILIFVTIILLDKLRYIDCFGDRAICVNSTKCIQFNKQYVLVFCDQVKDPLKLDFNCLIKNDVYYVIIRLEYPSLIDASMLVFIKTTLDIFYLEIWNIKGFEFKQNKTIFDDRYAILSLAKTQFDMYYNNNLIEDFNNTKIAVYKDDFKSPLTGRYFQIILSNNKYSKICSLLFFQCNAQTLQIMDLKYSFIKKNVIKFENWQNGSDLKIGSSIQKLSLFVYNLEIDENILNMQVFKMIEQININILPTFIDAELLNKFQNLGLLTFFLENTKEFFFKNRIMLGKIGKFKKK